MHLVRLAQAHGRATVGFGKLENAWPPVNTERFRAELLESVPIPRELKLLLEKIVNGLTFSVVFAQGTVNAQGADVMELVGTGYVILLQ